MSKKIVLKAVILVIFIIGLWYLIIPAPTSIDSFPPLPSSIKSTEPGDTIQNPNIAAYYTNYWRNEATGFYSAQYQRLHCQSFAFLNPFCFIAPIRLNHPVEYAFVYIRDQQQSTYLEEYLYPFRDSLFVNGYEPYDRNGKPFSKKSYPILIDGKFFNSKVTLRYYPSSTLMRVLVYILCWGALFWLLQLFKKVLKRND